MPRGTRPPWRRGRQPCPHPPACAADPARASGRRRRRTTICWSPPCACSCAPSARCGLTGWAISDTPEAQKRGSSSAPGICLRNSGANSPCTVEVWMPAFSNTRPPIRLMVPPPPRRAGLVGARPRRAHEARGRAVAQRRRRRQVRLHALERQAQVVAQGLEPRLRARLVLVERIVGRSHHVFASPSPTAAARRGNSRQRRAGAPQTVVL